MNQVIRVDMKSGRVYREEVIKDLKLIGGRGFCDHIINSEVDASCDPMGPHNKLVIAVGLLPDPRISSAGRLSFGAKSPLTGGIKESNAGGNVGQGLASLGIRSIVIEGKPKDDGLYVLVIKGESCELARMNELKELGNYGLNAKLQEKFGKHTSIISIGNAGEIGLPSAGIMCTDIDGSSSRIAARGGLGAVMGSKRIKAIIVAAQKKKRISVSDEKGFSKAVKQYHAAIRGNKVTNSVLPSFGTSSSIDTVNNMGALPTKNFSAGSFNLAGKINAQALSDLVKSRGGAGKLGKPCMSGCIIRCSNIIPDSEGKELVRALEYETLGMLGSNLCIGDLDSIARLNRLCNEYGVDTIEVGAALGVAMESGLLEFGDAKKAEEIVHEIGKGTLAGRLFGCGAAVVGKVLGSPRIPSVKGQGMSAYDPRTFKGIGPTYALSPQGADHTAGHPGFAPRDWHSSFEEVEVSISTQILRAAIDSVGLCVFTLIAVAEKLDLIANLINSVHGCAIDEGYFESLGREVIRLEREFNRRAGFSVADDCLPEFFYSESLPPLDVSFGVSKEELKRGGELLDGGNF